MVNLRKIGAIATGALFVGATLGSAAAVTFSPSMVVKEGAAAAKLVVGTKNPDASGLAADDASAGSIGSAVSTKYAAPATGANIQFKYDSQDVDGNTTTEDDVFKTAIASTDEGKWIANKTSGSSPLNLTSWNLTANDIKNNAGKDSLIGIRFDANGDGDVEDTDDQTIYNDIQIDTRTSSQLTIIPAMRLGDATAAEGKVFTLRGKKYYFKKYEAGQAKVVLIPTTEKTLFKPNDAAGLIDAAVLIPGTDIKIGLADITAGPDVADFAIIQGGAIIDTKNDKDISDPKTNLDLLSDYFIAVTKYDVATKYVTLSIAKKADEFSIYDGDKNVLGYAKAVIENSEWTNDELRFEDDAITIGKDSSAQLSSTTAYAKYTDDRKIEVVARKTKTAASGSDLKSTRDPWDDFLKKEADGGVDKVTVSAVGGTAGAVSLSKVKDSEVTATDKSGYNLVLVGGPVANSLTAELVTKGTSKVNWVASAGEIEVVENAFASGKSAIVVAGKDRAATKKAADALIALL